MRLLEPETGSGIGETRAALILPGAALTGCIALGVLRDTRGCDLEARDRVSHFPASPYVTLTICLKGELHLFENGLVAELPFPKITLSGPKQSPIASTSPGPALVLTVGFYPEASERLFGVPAGELLGQHRDWRQFQGSPLYDAIAGLAQLGEAETAFCRLEDVLRPIWQERRKWPGAVPVRVQDWMRGLAIDLMTSRTGRSLRALQRSFRAQTGQSQRGMQRVARVEGLYQKVVQGGGLQRQAEVAAEAGYADQSHMGREVRSVTGASPAEIMRLIESEESYWFYRLLAEYFGTQGEGPEAQAVATQPRNEKPA